MNNPNSGNKVVGWLVMGLIAVVAVVAAFMMKKGDSTPPSVSQNTPAAAKPASLTVLRGKIGGEKEEFFQDPEVQRILQERYNIRVEFRKVGSLEMASEENVKANDYTDFFFPASRQSADEIKGRLGSASAENIMSSPLVLFSHVQYIEPLVAKGIVTKQPDGVYNLSDPLALFKLIEQGATWESIGVPVKSRMLIQSAHPASTGSGSAFASLMAGMFNNGTVVEEKELPTILPKIDPFFRGYMEGSTANLFTGYARKGYPLVVGYENQIIEYAETKKDIWAGAKDKARIVYPEPTVWSDHVLVVKPNAKILIDALKDPEIQRIAWKVHGFRTDGASVENITKDVQGLAPEITNVMTMPSNKVLEQITNHFNK